MRYIVLTFLAFLTTAAVPTANAGGIVEPLKPVPQYTPPPAPTWAGFYIGGKLGFNKGKVNPGTPGLNCYCITEDDLDDLPGLDDFTKRILNNLRKQPEYPSNKAFHIFAGHNWEGNGLVYGVEVSFGKAKKKFLMDTIYAPIDMESEYSASLRMRVGKTHNNTLFYIAGGAAFESIKATNRFGGAKERKTLEGLTIGIGVDHKFSENWLGRFEVNHTKFKKTYFTASSYSGSKFYLDQTETSANIGLAYKF